MSDPSFYAARYQCKMSSGAFNFLGCMPTGAPTFATAMGGLQDANKLFLPMRLIIKGWSNAGNAAAEPNVKTQTVSARYRLAFQPGAGVNLGAKFSIYRCDRAADGSGGPPANPTSASQLKAAGCRSWSFAMGPSTLAQLNHRMLGTLWSSSVVYFVAVLGE
jgi:hypothetical protein